MATILVTGANRGIGLEFTQQYLARGERVLAACRDPAAATRLQQLRGTYPQLVLHRLDAADNESIAAFAAKLQGEAIDVFINNAGVYGPRDSRFGKVDGAVWLDVLQVNTVAPLLLTQALVANLRKGVQKKLIYLTSKMGSIADNGGGGHYIYRSSKTALNMVVKSLAIDLAGEGLVAAVLHPGWVQTDMGGPNAQIDTHTSVTGMIKVIDKLTPIQTGGFYNYDGAIIPW